MAIKDPIIDRPVEDEGSAITCFTQRAEGKNIYTSDIKYFVDSGTPFLKNKDYVVSTSNSYYTPVRQYINKWFPATYTFNLNSLSLSNYYKINSTGTNIYNTTYLRSIPLNAMNKTPFGMYIKNTYWGAEENINFYYKDKNTNKQTAIPFVSYINGQMPQIRPKDSDSSYDNYSLDITGGFPIYQVPTLLNPYNEDQRQIPTNSTTIYLTYYNNACYFSTREIKVNSVTVLQYGKKISEGPGVFLGLCGAGGGGGSCEHTSRTYSAGGGGGGASALVYLDLKFIANDLLIYNRSINKNVKINYVKIEIGAGGKWGTKDTSWKGCVGGPTVLHLIGDKSTAEITPPEIELYLPGGIGGAKDAAQAVTTQYGYGGGIWSVFDTDRTWQVTYPPIYFRNTFNNVWDSLQGIVYNNKGEKLYVFYDYTEMVIGSSSSKKTASSLDSINTFLNQAGIHVLTVYKGLNGGTAINVSGSADREASVDRVVSEEGKQGLSFTEELINTIRISHKDPLFKNNNNCQFIGRQGNITSSSSSYGRKEYGVGNWRWYKKAEGPSGGGGGASMFSRPYVDKLSEIINNNQSIISNQITAWSESNVEIYQEVNISPSVKYNDKGPNYSFPPGYGSWGGGGSGGVPGLTTNSSVNKNQNDGTPGQGTRGESGVVIFLPLH